jgi:adenosine/AMP kinase
MAIPVIDANAFPLNVVAQLSVVVAVGMVLSATPIL